MQRGSDALRRSLGALHTLLVVCNRVFECLQRAFSAQFRPFFRETDGRPQDARIALATPETRPFEPTEGTNGTDMKRPDRIVTFSGNKAVHG